MYVSWSSAGACAGAGIAQFMGPKSDCCDNAVCEAVHATLEKELLRPRSFRTRLEARTAMFDWSEAWYDGERRHFGLGYRSPERFEGGHEGSDCVQEDETIVIEEQANAASVYVSTETGAVQK